MATQYKSLWQFSSLYRLHNDDVPLGHRTLIYRTRDPERSLPSFHTGSRDLQDQCGSNLMSAVNLRGSDAVPDEMSSHVWENMAGSADCWTGISDGRSLEMVQKVTCRGVLGNTEAHGIVVSFPAGYVLHLQLGGTSLSGVSACTVLAG